MQSKNVLWLGLLFVLLLTAFCISRYINKFHPNIKNLSTPKTEIVDSTKLPSVQISKVLPTYNRKKDIKEKDIKEKDIKEKDIEEKENKDYLHTSKLVKQEEKDIEDTYNKALERKKAIEEAYNKALKEKEDIEAAYKRALEEERQQNLQKDQKLKPKILKIIPIEKPTYQQTNKISIENVLANQKLSVFDTLTESEKRKLKLLMLNIKQDPSCDIKIHADKSFVKLSKIINFIKSLGISESKIKIIQKSSDLVNIDQNYIELSIIKRIKP